MTASSSYDASTSAPYLWQGDGALSPDRGDRPHTPNSTSLQRFVVHATPLAELYVLERRRLTDDRGYFSRLFCERELGDLWPRKPVAQINESLTMDKGAVRGLHFQQCPHEETKFISCLSGEVFDVAVDIRPTSPTYLQWHAERLSAGNMRSMLVPPGFAHGFQALTQTCLLLYVIDTPYAPGFEGGLNPLDPELAIDWPLPVSLLSERDRNLPMIPQGTTARRSIT